MAVRSSRSPARTDGQRPLTGIPVEIYMLIVDELLEDADMPLVERKSILSNMNLVCRLFSALVAPKLFSLVSFRGAHVGASESGKRRRDSWLKQLAQGEETACLLGTFVRHVEYVDWMPQGTPAQRDRVIPDLGRHVHILPRFSNLKKLHLDHTPISSDLFGAITSLTRLETLTIEHCSYHTLRTKKALPEASLPHLVELNVSMVEDDFAAYVPALASLATTPTLQSLKTTEWPLARAIMEASTDVPLKHFETTYMPSDVHILFAFLCRTPTLTSLCLTTPLDAPDDDLRSSSSHSALPDTSLPRLRELRCPLSLLAPLFRPSVSRLNLVDTSDWFRLNSASSSRLLEPLEQCALKELDVPMWAWHRFPLQRYTPKLAKLAVCFPLLPMIPLETMIGAFCNFGPKLSLQTLELRFADSVYATWKLNLRMQHNMVVAYLARRFPTASCFTLADAIEWHRVANANGSAWQPVVRERECVKELLQCKDNTVWEFMEVADYDGALAALFTEGEMTAAIAKRLSRGGAH
ncbi:hypothetical protein IEO21_04803 [Rhodonia placenta]|uniref:F-box domain-containing protein n=1 Tax=Rhodonia placenta TaxID=104341 RepID=A0A8H7P358_9APHY|nr:hypothetical protein IEO21_04803 [Postia placenta]